MHTHHSFFEGPPLPSILQPPSLQQIEIVEMRLPLSIARWEETMHTHINIICYDTGFCVPANILYFFLYNIATVVNTFMFSV